MVFVQGKKISLLLERWAEKKWTQLSFSSAIPCGITRAITTGTGSQPSSRHPASQPSHPPKATNQRNSCGSSDFWLFTSTSQANICWLCQRGILSPQRQTPDYPKTFWVMLMCLVSVWSLQIFCKPCFSSSFLVNFSVNRNFSRCLILVLLWLMLHSCLSRFVAILVIDSISEWPGSAAYPRSTLSSCCCNSRKGSQIIWKSNELTV